MIFNGSKNLFVNVSSHALCFFLRTKSLIRGYSPEINNIYGSTGALSDAVPRDGCSSKLLQKCKGSLFGYRYMPTTKWQRLYIHDLGGAVLCGSYQLVMALS